MSDASNRRHITCPGCHRPVFANEEGASTCIVCGTSYDGSSVPEEDSANLREKVRKEGYQPEGLSATVIPAASHYGAEHRSDVESKGDLRLVWDGATHKRSTVAELIPAFMAAAIGLGFFPDAGMLARITIAAGFGGLAYLVTNMLVSDALRHFFEVRGTEIVVREGTIWSDEVERIGVDDVDQLYVIRFARGNESDKSYYELRCRLRDGAVVSMCRDLHSLEQALWIEYQLERHLGVIDVPVAGEIGRV